MSSTPQTWLCLRFTHLALNSLGYHFNSQTPVVIGHHQQIWQCNLPALKSGIKQGMSINHALLLNPELKLQERNISTEIATQLKLSHWAYRFTSLVSLYKEDAILLEVGKSSKLFNGLKHLINLITNDLNNYQIEANLGLAHTPKAAIALSFIGHQTLNDCQQALAKTELSHLEIEEKTTQKLLHCGFKTLGDLSAIPQKELGARFGQAFLKHLQQLHGKLADPQVAIIPPETFYACADFAEPIRNITWIQQQLDRLLSDLEYFIRDRQLLCRSFIWHFYDENNRLIKDVRIGLNAQNKLDSALKELSKLKLERLELDWEFSKITLSSRDLLPQRLFNNDLFNPIPCQEQFHQLLDKLSSRLGPTAVFQLKESSEQLPELANQCFPANNESIAEPSITDDSILQGPSHVALNSPLKDEPLWLLENPKRLAKQHQLPILKGPVNIIHGPNRISSHWWTTLQSRDYFIARQRNGRLLWVFFDRSSKDWFLHGLYA